MEKLLEADGDVLDVSIVLAPANATTVPLVRHAKTVAATAPAVDPAACHCSIVR